MLVDHDGAAPVDARHPFAAQACHRDQFVVIEALGAGDQKGFEFGAGDLLIRNRPKRLTEFRFRQALAGDLVLLGARLRGCETVVVDQGVHEPRDADFQ